MEKFQVKNQDILRKKNESELTFETITEFLYKLVEKNDSINLADFYPLVCALESALATISYLLRNSHVKEISDGTLSIADATDKLFIDALMSSKSCAGFIAESHENIIQGSSRGAYICYLSSETSEERIRRGLATGFTFAFVKCPEELCNSRRALKDSDVLLKGKRIELAGYALFGCSTECVMAVSKQGLHQFSLDISMGTFIATKKYIEIPQKGQLYFMDQGESKNWDDIVDRFIEIKTSLVDSNLRYFNPGDSVCMLHAIIKNGGVHLLGDEKISLLCRANPIAFILKEGNGQSLTGDFCDDVLQITATSLQMKTGLVCGSFLDVELLKDLFNDRIAIIS